MKPRSIELISKASTEQKMKFDFLQVAVQSCALCGGSQFVTLKRNDRYRMRIVTVGCAHCGLIQTNPRPSESGLKEFYSKYYRKFYQGITHPTTQYIETTYKSVRMVYTVDFINKVIPTTSITRVLDIGCGEGAFFSALIASGFKGYLTGVEPNRQFADFAEKSTGATTVCSLGKVIGKYDLIVLNHVLEHILNPAGFLQEVATHLSDGGYLYIDVPDADEYSSLADLHIAHIYHFTTRTLSYLLDVNNYVIKKIEKHSPPFHPKSIRVVAVKNGDCGGMGSKTSIMTEKDAWERLRRISVIYFLIRQRVTKLQLARKIYRYFVHRFL